MGKAYTLMVIIGPSQGIKREGRGEVIQRRKENYYLVVHHWKTQADA